MTVKTTKINNMPCILADDILLFDPNSGLGSYNNTILGSFTYPSGDKPCSIMINAGKDIFSSACHSWLGFPETVIYRYKDGKFGVGKFKSTTEIPNRANVLWAIGGMGLLDKYNPDEEGFSRFVKNGKTYDYSDVRRRTAHNILGIKDNKCYLVYVSNMNGTEINAFAKKCGFEIAILGDGGHLAAINGSESYAKININTKQGYAIQGINSNFNKDTVTTPEIPTNTVSKKYVVALDAGHSKLVSGKSSFDNTYHEYECNINILEKVQPHLIRHNIGCPFIDYENSSATAELTEVIKRINATKANICVSFHSNAFGTELNSANGWEAFYFESVKFPESKKLAELIHKESLVLGLTDRGIKSGNNLGLIKNTTMPACLIETAFHTNLEDLEKLKTREFREKCALAYAKGIVAYFGLKWIDEVKVVETIKTIYKVQLGAFKDKENALTLQSKLYGSGYNSIIIFIDELYKVQVGAFINKENAITLQKKLELIGYSAIIKEIK